MRWLRTELRVALVLRSRALGPMLTSSAGELWSVLLRFGPIEAKMSGLAHSMTAFFYYNRGPEVYVKNMRC
jgi:hypothetical protein